MARGKHRWRKPRSGRPAVVWAVMLPMLFGSLTALLSSLFPVNGPDNLEDIIDYTEDTGLILVAGYVVALVLSAVFGRQVARGRTSRVPWLIGAAFLPWICGIVATEHGYFLGLTAYESVHPSAAALAVGKLLAVAGATTYLGMVLTASLLLSAGLVLAIAADHFRTVLPGAGRRLLHALLALPLFGLAAYCSEMREPMLAFPLAPAALVVLIGLILAARSSALATDRRGFGLDTAAFLALGLGWFVTAEMVRWGVAFDAYEGLESAAPDSRGYVIESALRDTIPIDTATRGAWAALGLMLLFTARGAESTQRFGGAAAKAIVMAVIFCVVAFGVSEQRRFREDRMMKVAVVPEFAEIEGFEPAISMDRECYDGADVHHALVGRDRVWTWTGQEVSIDRLQSESGRRSLARIFVDLLQGQVPPPPRPPVPFNIARYRERLDQTSRSRSGELLLSHPNLSLVLDARLTPTMVASVLDAASRAGANSVDLVIMRSAEPGYLHIPGLPVSYGDFPYACSERVFLARAISAELYVRDTALAHTRLDRPESVQVMYLRDGRLESFHLPLTGGFDREEYPYLDSPVRPLYVRFGPAATAGTLSSLATRAHRLGNDPVILFGDAGTLSAVLQFRQNQARR
jgi:hypothetical protein